ncbi:hypothetical protein [Sinorhizobium meliloti]|uniref:hypothetical protein n=1 Tax=Rhizobium meliloti TaxID=382 RepID=UPI001F440FB4|nr:hypothetical protein [Sinorhizobium meliloti]
MDFRNPVYSSPDNSTIDMEINHPKYGWIPFTASASDVEDHGRQLFADASAGSVTPYEFPSIEEIRNRMPYLTARQLRLGLVGNGYSMSQVSAVIDAMPEGADKETARIEWEYATTFERTHPLIATVGAALAISEEQIDSMWTEAASL